MTVSQPEPRLYRDSDVTRLCKELGLRRSHVVKALRAKGFSKYYNRDGYSGCVSRRRSRDTGTLVGVYNAVQAGMDPTHGCTWYTVCEDHGSVIGHETLSVANYHAPVPSEWCEDCMEKQKEKECDSSS